MSLQTVEKHKQKRETGPFAFLAKVIAQYKRAGWQRFYERVRVGNSVAHVNDCSDGPAQLQLTAFASELLGRHAGFHGAEGDLEGAGGIISALHAFNDGSHPRARKHTNIILANVAPRNGEAKKKYENGTPFGYFWKDGTLVVSTVDGAILSLAKKLGVTDSVHVLDTKKTLAVLRKAGQITIEEEKEIGETQFRSLEFAPRVAAYLLRYKNLPGAEQKSLDDIDVPQAVWHVDVFSKFANCKTTLLPEDVLPADVAEKLQPGNSNGESGPVGELTTRFGVLPVYRRLKDVPEGEAAVIRGSTGLGEKRLLEIVVQGGSAAAKLGIAPGDKVI